MSWIRDDQAFFAAGACHVLAWTCHETYAKQDLRIVGLKFAGQSIAFHVIATWRDWAFDHCGWNLKGALILANEQFESRAIESFAITSNLVGYCQEHRSRLPGQYHADPRPRALSYVRSFDAPWIV